MKYLCLLALCSCTGMLFAQYYKDEHYNRLFRMESSVRFRWYTGDPNVLYGKNASVLAGIDTVKRFSVERKGRMKLSKTHVLNKQGLLAAEITKKAQHLYMYSDTLLMAVNTTLPNGKTFSSNYGYREGRLTSVEYYSKGSIDERYIYVYNGSVCVARVYTDLSHRREHVYMLQNELGADGKIAKATYTIDGKVKNTWDYSCNEKGTAADDKQAQASSCTYEQQNNDGSYSVFTRSIREGETYLEEAHYSADSVMTGWKQFIRDTVLIRENTLTKNYERFDHYTKKGKFRAGYVNALDDKGRITETSWYDKRNRQRTTTRIIYNEKGLVSELHFLKKGKKYSEERFEYSSGAR